jgi:hypothetical protein
MDIVVRAGRRHAGAILRNGTNQRHEERMQLAYLFDIVANY